MSEIEVLDENQQIHVRREKLQQWRDQGHAFPNDFKRTHIAANLHADYDACSHDDLQAKNITVTIAGRIMARRIMGKASFISVQDMSGKIQLYVTREDLPENFYDDEFKKWDLGDLIGATGVLFKTKTDELSIRVQHVRLLTKAIRPLPDKWHGLADIEARYRQRYVDLIMNEDVRRNFQIRSAAVAATREFFRARDFIEVETPMLQVLAGGATAKPFETHHNAPRYAHVLAYRPRAVFKAFGRGWFRARV